MYGTPETMFLLAAETRRALIEEADRQRLLNAARRTRRRSRTRR